MENTLKNIMVKNNLLLKILTQMFKGNKNKQKTLFD